MQIINITDINAISFHPQGEQKETYGANWITMNVVDLQGNAICISLRSENIDILDELTREAHIAQTGGGDISQELIDEFNSRVPAGKPLKISIHPPIPGY